MAQLLLADNDESESIARISSYSGADIGDPSTLIDLSDDPNHFPRAITYLPAFKEIWYFSETHGLFKVSYDGVDVGTIELVESNTEETVVGLTWIDEYSEIVRLKSADSVWTLEKASYDGTALGTFTQITQVASVDLWSAVVWVSDYDELWLLLGSTYMKFAYDGTTFTSSTGSSTGVNRPTGLAWIPGQDKFVLVRHHKWFELGYDGSTLDLDNYSHVKTMDDYSSTTGLAYVPDASKVYVGSTKAASLYVGSTNVKTAYVGSSKVFG